jgi:decaprenylphospho-beta-D-ribofuranose 2-oxidase
MSTRRADTELLLSPSQDLDCTPTQVSGWGGGDPCPVWRWTPRDTASLQAGLRRLDRGGAIARGLGRSYGDAAQRRGGTAIDTSGLRWVSLDPVTGLVTAGAGLSLRELLAVSASRGWIVPVVPGTQHVTVGGAIASDIHGKNHGTLGTFTRHVRALGLLCADGEVLEREPETPEFQATAGGMGLTGVIVWARIQLRRVGSAMLSVDTDRAENLEEALALLSAPGGEHRVAWLDLLTSGTPRGVVTRAAHLDEGELSPGLATRSARARVPAGWPGGLLSPATVRAFNELRFRSSPRHERGKPEGFAAHMFPLDGLEAWPRLYGKAGFVQYQFVVPQGAERVIEQVLETLRHAQVPCYLAVLKDFGPAGPGLLSFPLQGWTLALDLPRAADGLLGALERCDERVAEAGGRVYLSKDARLSAEMTQAMYPRLGEWRQVRGQLDPDGLWQSDLGLRTGLLETTPR